MIQDLHEHTYYSFCGRAYPEEVIRAAIESGIELLGFCDHNYGIALQRPETIFPNETERLFDYQRSVNRYLDHLGLLKKTYEKQLTILRGIELCTRNLSCLYLPENIDISGFDYCLLENLDQEDTIISDLFAYRKTLGCPWVGITHTDLPAFLDRKGVDKLDYFTRMAQNHIFWELNVNYDSIHGYREHAYVKHFLEDQKLQELVRKSGLLLSVGFDGHRVEDYLPERVKQCCEKLKELKLPMVFENK